MEGEYLWGPGNWGTVSAGMQSLLYWSASGLGTCFSNCRGSFPFLQIQPINVDPGTPRIRQAGFTVETWHRWGQSCVPLSRFSGGLEAAWVWDTNPLSLHDMSALGTWVKILTSLQSSHQYKGETHTSQYS